ncbi:MAG: glutathione peroxidase [Ezakiella sp.]|nr:glutathione peroxidase [Ezakiella sp.]
MNIYDFKVENNEGKLIDLSDYENKVLLVVNTATKCGYTKQYKYLEEIYQDYKDKGFEILDFPCNQFGGQAPGSDEEINKFVCEVYDTSFPRFKKIEVNGDNASPLYKWLKSIDGKEIGWNFTKFLIGRDGEIIKKMTARTGEKSIRKKIEEAL